MGYQQVPGAANKYMKNDNTSSKLICAYRRKIKYT